MKCIELYITQLIRSVFTDKVTGKCNNCSIHGHITKFNWSVLLVKPISIKKKAIGKTNPLKINHVINNFL